MRLHIVQVIIGAILLAGQAAGAKFTPARALKVFLPATQPATAVGGGEVLLEVVVSDQGLVRDIHTLRATPPFTPLVIEVVRSWSFAPATVTNPNEPPRAMESSVLVAAVFRPPTLYNAPGIGELPKDLRKPSDRVVFPARITVPTFPPQALFDGMVLVEAAVTPKGTVGEAKIIGAGSGFEKASLDAVQAWQFQPTRQPAYAYIIFGYRQPVIVQP